MLTKLILQSSLWLFFLALLLFLGAGTIYWTAGWIYMLTLGITGFLISRWLYQHDQALLKERLKPVLQKGQNKWDKVFILIFISMFLIWYPVMGLDAKRYAFSHVPVLLQWVGFVAVIFGMYVVFLAFKANSYAAPIIKIQNERTQVVIDTGAYGVIRHPMYTGMVLYFFGTPLLLSSWIGLVYGVCLSILLALRILLEESILQQSLNGYTAYMAKVRYRLFPYIW